MDTRVKELIAKFTNDDLITCRELVAGGRKAYLLFMQDLTKEEVIEKALFALAAFEGEISNAKAVTQKILFTRQITTETDLNEATQCMLMGDCVCVIEGLDELIILDAKAWDKRGLMEPPVENVLRGPREGFIEDIKSNLQMLQRRMRTPQLKVERLRIGHSSNTAIAVVYLANIANPKIVKEIKRRLEGINIDMVYDSATLEPFLEQRPLSIFKQVGYTERPDIASSRIAEGRVAIIVDGSPVVLTLPFLLIEDFHSAEDHYQKFNVVTFLRILRLCALAAALLLPGFYVALLQFHYDLLPINFLMSLLNAVKGTPLPPLAEVLLVMILFEILRESALRMPKIIGLAMGVVGGIVLGEAAILSGLLSPSSVLVVAISSIAMFTVPNHLGASMLLRFAFTIVGGLLGLFGMLIMAVFLIHYLADFHMYGAPYLSPIAPFDKQGYRDSVIKRPVFELTTRPKSVHCVNECRVSMQQEGQE